MTTVTIIGCGAIGAMLAYELSKDLDANALEVTVLEAQSQPAMQATGASLGVLMAASSSKAKGGLVSLRLASLRRFDRLITELTQQTNRQILYNRHGILNLSRSPEAEIKARSLIEIRKAQGFELQWLEQDDMSQRFPQWLADGGLFSPCDRAVHPKQLVEALVEAATQNGVKFCWNVPVQDLGNIKSDRLVITAGLGSNALVAPYLPKSEQDLLIPVGGQALLVKVPDLHLQNIIHAENEDSSDINSDINIVPLGGDRYWIGATLEFEYEVLPRPANVQFLLDQAIAWCPAFAQAEVLETWAGDRPRPQCVKAPILGFLPNHPRILLATGHYRNGVMMAAVTAQITKDLLLYGSSDLPWQSFALSP
ncbi:FAD-binding oxidoreductase [Pseudanabaena sp. FACHB-1998]|uniref:NAD(P)/FAD-dependent oxidoreductase n=1 Tax=Pseudanabaena sp. FACHB-1998 TaxID=2692858 RepID=UPI001681BC73|nr:FAD-dependent oxidoreductase [Pseudanabaena sp. FACHB-1998]MBD2177836.1 FAD-binding oxidoreductase [Pseudanabaena sp. FACHB-1998]